MALTEKEQINKEIDAIMQARPGPERDIDVSPLYQGKSLLMDGFCFGQYRGHALYESGVASFPIKWEKEEPPPLTIQIKMSLLPNGKLQFDIRGKGFPTAEMAMRKVEE